MSKDYLFLCKVLHGEVFFLSLNTLNIHSLYSMNNGAQKHYE